MEAQVEDRAKVAFDLGWDFAAYEMLPPENIRQDPHFQQGYNEGRHRKIKQDHDRFVRKWLLLRMNAYLRNRLFDPAVNPAYLKFIDVDTCPITDVKLTHGTMSDNDWSVDRINNHGAYARGNLVVVSAKANKAKTNFDPLDIWGIVEENVPVNGLTPYQWARWKLITSMVNSSRENGAFEISYLAAPCVAIPPKGVPTNLSVVLQMEICSAAIGQPSAMLDRFAEVAGKSKKRVVNDLIRDARKRIPGLSWALDMWRNERLFNDFKALHDSLTPQERLNILRMGASLKNGPLKGIDFDEEALSFNSDGYVPPAQQRSRPRASM